MNCSYDRDLLQEFAIGEVSEAQRREVENHLAACSHCRSEVAFERQLARDLAAIPEPNFPQDLEEVLVRSSVQAAMTGRAGRAVKASRLQPAWVLALGGAAGLGIMILIALVLWPARVSTWGALDTTGGGQGIGLLDGLTRWIADFRSALQSIEEFLGYFAPVAGALRVAMGTIGSSVWAALVLGALSTTLLLWRITSTGRKMRVTSDAKQHSS